MPARWPGRNFFSRVTHSHPGRVVWVVFNTLIAFMLMEMNVFQALGDVLGLYSNIAIAWMMAVVADLVVNKPLGLSPPGIEFKRAHLYDINPVGVGAMALASVLSIAAHLGVFGPMAQAFSARDRAGRGLRRRAADRLGARKGRYYIARAARAAAGLPALYLATRAASAACICEREYEARRHGALPGLPGRRSARCAARSTRAATTCASRRRSLSAQWSGALRWLLPRRVWPYLDTGLGHFLLLMLIVVPLLAAAVRPAVPPGAARAGAHAATPPSSPKASLRSGFLKAYMALAGDRRHRRLVAGAGAQEPPGGAGGVEPPDRTC